MKRLGFVVAVFLYAVFSSPTPDTPGMVEYAILALLLFSATAFVMPRGRWTVPFLILLGYGVTVPLAVAVFAGNAGGDIMRDLVAFGALAVPVVFYGLFPADKDAQKILLALLLGVGMLFSVRYLVQAFRDLTSLGLTELDHHFLYLANSPLVAFAAGYLLLRGCFTEKRIVYAAGLVVLSLIPIAAMVGMLQRATLALLALAWVGLLVHTIVKNPKRGTAVLGSCFIVMGVLWPLPGLVWESLSNKTLQLGWNARGYEIAALLDSLDQNVVTAIFGTGWGSLVKSPAVGDLWVRFSHSLMTSLLWKTGWIGLVMGAGAIAALTIDAVRRLRQDLVMATALVLPLLPALFLYGSYKSLCFGLLLLGLARLNGQAPAISDKPIAST